jgi:hypothetical protein
MALVNPQIAMSYRPTTEYQPRNALAEYAQLQSIVGAQRQAEVADMQLQRMRQEDAEIERIHQLAKQYGAPESRLKMGQELFASRNPQQRELGYKIIQHEENKALFERAERNFGYASSSAAPAAAPAAPAAVVVALRTLFENSFLVCQIEKLKLLLAHFVTEVKPISIPDKPFCPGGKSPLSPIPKSEQSGLP